MGFRLRRGEKKWGSREKKWGSREKRVQVKRKKWGSRRERSGVQVKRKNSGVQVKILVKEVGKQNGNSGGIMLKKQVRGRENNNEWYGW